MGLFDFFFFFNKAEKELTWEYENTYTGETPDCPNCGTPLTKRYVFSGMYCENCRYGLEDDDEDDYESDGMSTLFRTLF